jgi:dihydrodipicolinate synthase/N-acetylneuraminate lyase
MSYGPVFPIIPCFDEIGQLNLDSTLKYIHYLEACGAVRFMTTAGTTQFNLLTREEIFELNMKLGVSIQSELILGVPPESIYHQSEMLKKLLQANSKAKVLLSYPERFYEINDIVDYFSKIERQLPDKTQLYIHGLALRDGRKGAREFDWELINAILSSTSMVAGMKEECSNYEAGFLLCADCPPDIDFEFIVAGGSMRRFLFLGAVGAQSFLTGIGSLFPQVELCFYEHYMSGRMKEVNRMIRYCEAPFFKTFMGIGWHKALRYAGKKLGILDTTERSPMTTVNLNQANDIEEGLLKLELCIKELQAEGVIN